MLARMREFCQDIAGRSAALPAKLRASAVRDLLVPARKEVVKMLTSGVSGLFEDFKTTPMYAVSVELRTLQQRQGRSYGRYP